LLSRRLFEGPDIQKVLARIQSELGPSAQIISAEKVRRGGVGGFFSRETYQVVVDGPEAPVSRPTLLSSRRRAARIAPAPAAPDVGRKVPVPSTEGAPFAEVLRRLTENAQPMAEAEPAPVATVPAGAEPTPAPTQVDAVVDEDLTALLRQMSAARAMAETASEPASAEAWIEEAQIDELSMADL
jgi:flagellar biosynthesis GTPase FlhF